jgi:hypothetical protein
MKPSRKVDQAISFVAILLFGGLSAAQEPKAKDWGNTAHGVQMSMLVLFYHRELMCSIGKFLMRFSRWVLRFVLSVLPCSGIRVVGFDDLPQIYQRCLMAK